METEKAGRIGELSNAGILKPYRSKRHPFITVLIFYNANKQFSLRKQEGATKNEKKQKEGP
jgi:hypothetical protein